VTPAGVYFGWINLQGNYVFFKTMMAGVITAAMSLCATSAAQAATVTVNTVA
jgi:hypothetical protein